MHYLYIYIGIIVLLSILLTVFTKHQKKISKILTEQVDNLLYLFDKYVYFHKDEIYDYKNTQALLFHNQQQFFKDGKHYEELIEPLMQDTEYLSSLIEKNIISPEAVAQLKETFSIWKNVSKIRYYTYIILIIFTLGIAKLFIND